MTRQKEEGEPMNASRKSFALFLVIWVGQLPSKIGGGIGTCALGSPSQTLV